LGFEKFMSWISSVGWIESLVFDGIVWCEYGSDFGPLASLAGPVWRIGPFCRWKRMTREALLGREVARSREAKSLETHATQA
jgi:hypothetical protein